MNMNKKPRIKSKALRESARGEDCLLRIPGVCSWQPDETILAHNPYTMGNNGIGIKTDDLFSIYACSKCHDCIDRLEYVEIDPDQLELMARRAMQATQLKFIEKGLISVAK